MTQHSTCIYCAILSSPHNLSYLYPHSSWVSDMVAVLQADELPQDVAGAEALLTFHSEHKAEIDARQDSFTSFKKKAEPPTKPSTKP